MSSGLDIQNHLYEAFLQARTCDVALNVKGSQWHAVYHLHRVVLIQSGFFRSLFTAGFSESSPRRQSNAIDEIEVVFDDLNITRADPFIPTISHLSPRICLSRLYGGGPPLNVPTSLIPTVFQPLASWPRPPSFSVPEGHHLASPRFLISLLATSIFLSIPSLASFAISSIHNTIGPYTVLQYLRFALGTPITTSNRHSSEPEAAVGLEHVAQMLEDNDDQLSFVSSNLDEAENDHESEQDGKISTSSPLRPHHESQSPSFHYGAISDKIGEAASVWLTRWGSDFFKYEEGEKDRLPKRNRAASLPSPLDPGIEVKETMVPLIWRRGGLSPKWIRAIISSDSLFVKTERDRYDLARSVVEVRRREGILPDEEAEWTLMFNHSIYYSNMAMEDLVFISQDISPTTNLPFVQLETLQAAHWSASLLKHKITYRSPSSSSSTGSPAPVDKELGLSKTTAAIQSLVASDSREREKPYYTVSPNSSSRLGENGQINLLTSLSMDELFDTSKATGDQIVSESSFFGLLPRRYLAEDCHLVDLAGTTQFSDHCPFRFSVEFWDTDSLKEKQRLHSQTIWYAGSLFNVYINVQAKKKGQSQLGIYLHRQSSVDPIPPCSAPRGALQHSRGPSLPVALPPGSPSSSSLPPSPGPVHYSPSIHPLTRSTTPVSRGPTSSSLPYSSAFSASGSPAHRSPSTTAGISPAQPYRDPRPLISLYFNIYCASPTGNSQTRFESAPDVMKVGQSWGWKSSSLSGDEMEAADERGQSSLRASVVLGLV
ncbi:hypothetical protein C8J56DRAFT_1011435 [Mycena floridula]|nr:hypothetical protein C8J56DRAFT_1011435 [Mycena floridula]